jgi:signal transduction histidine kinase
LRKVAFIFAISILAPSLILAWLAIRSLSTQRIVFERQQTLFYQGVCNNLVKDIGDWFADQRSSFGRQVESLISGHAPLEVARNFDPLLLPAWPLARVGFAVTLQGQVLSPSLMSRRDARRFRLENESFLSNQESVEVFWRSPKGDISFSQLDEKFSGEGKGTSGKGDLPRKVFPQKDPQADGKATSRVAAQEAEFKQFLGDSTDGTLARFLQNQLKLLMWYRSPRDTGIVFGAELNLPSVTEKLHPLVQGQRPLWPDICVAVIDDNGRPVARSHPEFVADWKRPFVSAEIGEILPHWEVAAYLLNPAKLTQSAQTLALTLSLLICVLLLAIGVGGWLIVRDLQRQLLLTRRKTDFVSNVSHELKTPLTSIRMFSEILADGRMRDPAKERTYLNVITYEAARLTRLINNVLDFARLERGEKEYRLEKCDLVDIARGVVENYRPQLEAQGFRFDCELPETAVFIMADRDAIAQIILNLLSNAEKYSGHGKEIVVRISVTKASGSSPGSAELRVLDRGSGVPAGMEEKIFEQFFRAHDSLSSGIPGSGLGLTLARQIARAHGGDVFYARQPRAGSCFILRLPV